MDTIEVQQATESLRKYEQSDRVPVLMTTLLNSNYDIVKEKDEYQTVLVHGVYQKVYKPFQCVQCKLRFLYQHEIE